MIIGVIMKQNDLSSILQKFDNFVPETDCLVMIGSPGDRFSFYIPDRYLTESKVPVHAEISMVFAYLCAHPYENREMLDQLIDKALEWMHS